MSVIKITRTLARPAACRRSLLLRSFREISRRYLAYESDRHFIVEALIFALITAISAWPIIGAAMALREFMAGIGA
jgi:hypothetical protein